MSLNNTSLNPPCTRSLFLCLLREWLTRLRCFNSQPTGPCYPYTDRGSNCKRDNSAPTSLSVHSLPCSTKQWYHFYLKISEISAESEENPSGTIAIQNGISLVELTHQLIPCHVKRTRMYRKRKGIIQKMEIDRTSSKCTRIGRWRSRVENRL